jgi:hypothetical protein
MIKYVTLGSFIFTLIVGIHEAVTQRYGMAAVLFTFTFIFSFFVKNDFQTKK